MSSGGERERPLVRLAAFAALGLYGLARWATLLHPVPGWRLLGLGALALIVAAGGPLLRARCRRGALIGAVLALLAIFPLAGLPLTWLAHLRVAVSVDGIGQGLGALPRVLLPYIGINEWVRIVISLGAGVLLLDAALLLAFAPRPLGDLRRAGAASALVALAVVPSTLIRPQLPYLQGLVLFGLLAAFMWGERARGDRLTSAVAIAAVAGVLAALASPGLDQRRPWVNYQALAGTFSATHVESFDWSQRYGPIDWPRLGREVLDVRAARPDYWKAENLELFDGARWVPGQLQAAPAVSQPRLGAARRFTQPLQVTIRAMRTTDVIAAGVAGPPLHVPGGAAENVSPGTWTAGAELGPGDSYTVGTYSPRPTAAELTAAGHAYPDRELSGERSISLPGSSRSAGPAEIVFAPFHAPRPVQRAGASGGNGGTVIIRASPYARAFALARRLARRAPTPYAFVLGVERHLSSSHGFRYDESPPRSAYPLERFLFKDRIGYCQQFSGAMALLLRMGGVPARVSAGFTSGTYDPADHRWVVSDLDAHSWVEAYFPRYGWVRFDPTPAAAPARGGHASLPGLRDGAGAGAGIVAHAKPRQPPPALTPQRAPVSRGDSSLSLLGIALAVIAAGTVAVAAVLRWIRQRRAATGEQLVAELERALARCGRSVGGGVTLAALEHRFGTSPPAAAYVRALRMARFGGAGEPPTTAQRRALRRELAAGRGVLGLVRALWALPPGGAPRG